MSASHHTQKLSNYLNGHKKRRDSAVERREAVRKSWNRRMPPSSTECNASPAKEKTTIKRTMPQLSRAATVHDLPDEILLKIFAYFLPGELLVLGLVCRRWHLLSDDNLLWHRIYYRFVSGKYRKEASKLVSDGNLRFWRNQCFQRCSEMRNLAKILSRKKLDRFTGLLAGTEESIKKMGIKWMIEFTNQHKEVVHEFINDDSFHFTMASHVRWFNLPQLNLDEIVAMKVFALNPIFFDSRGKPLSNSPCLRSLLHEQPFKWSDIKSKSMLLASDDSESIDLHALDNGILLATWKNGGGVAFIAQSFHHHMFLEKCLKGSPTCSVPLPAHQPYGDDIDRQLGLHSYRCSLELRNQRSSFWKEQFLNVHCIDKPDGGYAHLQLIHPEKDYERGRVGKRLSLLWKTSALKGVVKDLCYFDLTVLAEGTSAMWCNSSPVTVDSSQKKSVNYMYSGENQVIEWEDQHGKVYMLLIWDDDDREYFITDLRLSISIAFINQWFGTRH